MVIFPFFFKIFILNFQEKKSQIFLRILSLLNTNKIMTIFKLGFENIFYHFLEILNNYSQVFIHNLKLKNLKPFLTKKCILVIKTVSNKIILINYSQKLLLKGSFSIINNLNFQNNCDFKNNFYGQNQLVFLKKITIYSLFNKNFFRKLINFFF